MVGFDVSEDWFHIYWPSLSVVESFFAGQSFSCLSFMFVERVVNFNDPVNFGFMACTRSGHPSQFVA